MGKVTQLLQQAAKFVWPVAILIILVLYRQPLVDLLATRSVKVGTTGVEIGAPAQATQTPASVSSPESITTAHAESFGPEYQALAALIDKLIEASIPVVMVQQNMSRDAALKYIAVSNAGNAYLEKASRFIFGSQLDAIDLVNGAKGPVKIDKIRALYTKAQSELPEFYKNYDFDQWLGFLTSRQLVEVHGDDVVSTPGGIALIPYMRSQGYLAMRPPG